MKVLLGIGGSDGSFEALADTVTRAEEAGDEVTVAIVDRDDIALTPDEIETEVREQLAETGMDPEIRQLSGHPGSRLVEVAEQEQFDRLVVAGGERSPLGKINFDETLEFVLLNAETTVTLVR
ncbi:universal stress protein [Halorientalis regularis]|jgi:nucleotide-binding universal stress UspA family protein|uniref:Universal stress protein family protein n=1 Tax=Halorientalis regularis TaxID=660518 RepID=A0A1G7KXL7_9EURY|nr:universal stress protein [Halorientalis regularis]SDF41836.1 Universal stress protein family protein [Halorientalis regularis]